MFLLHVVSYLLLSSPFPHVQDDGEKPKKTGFTISKETTYFTEPVTPEGYIDYLAAINKKLSVGVTPENNAMVQIMKALGPKPEKARLHSDFYKMLGVAELPEKGEYYVDLFDWIRSKKKQQNQEVPENKTIEDWHTRITSRPWTRKEFPDLAGWVDANAVPLQHVLAANRCSHYFMPFVTKPHGAPDSEPSRGMMSLLLPTVQRCRGLTNLLLARAMLHVGEKKPEAAWNDIHEAMKLGRVVARGSTLIEMLVGIAISIAAEDATLVLLDQGNCSVELLSKMKQDFSRLEGIRNSAIRIGLGERCMALETLMLVHRYGFAYLERIGGNNPSGGPLKPSKTLHQADWDPAFKKVNDHYDRLTALFNEPDIARRRANMQLFDSEIKKLYVKTRDSSDSMMRFLYGPQKRVELISELALALLTPALIKVQHSWEKHELRVDTTTLAIALARYKKEKGEYPETLMALAPAYLKEIPNDYFSGKLLNYKKTDTGYRLYSVGVNGKDDGGVTREEDTQCDDLVFIMPVPPLTKLE